MVMWFTLLLRGVELAGLPAEHPATASVSIAATTPTRRTGPARPGVAGLAGPAG
jgi:hypothetical protein